RISRKRGKFRRNRATGGDEGVIVSAEIEGQRLGMESLGEVVVQESSEFMTIGDGARLVREILEDEARIVGGAKEGAIDALRAAFHDRTGSPDQSNAEEGAESHAKLRVIHKETRKETSEEEDGQKSADEK